MPDKFFFPLILALAISLVWMASARPDEACPQGSVGAADTNYITIEIAGRQLNRFMPGEGIEMATCTSDADYILALTATQDTFPPSPDIGPHFRLARDIERAVSEREIRLTIRARTSAQNGASSFEANYHTGPNGNSGWQTFTLSNTFKDFTFEYSVPKANKEHGVDYLGIRPIPVGEATSLEIESVTLFNVSLAGG